MSRKEQIDFINNTGTRFSFRCPKCKGIFRWYRREARCIICKIPMELIGTLPESENKLDKRD